MYMSMYICMYICATYATAYVNPWDAPFPSSDGQWRFRFYSTWYCLLVATVAGLGEQTNVYMYMIVYIYRYSI